MELMFVDEGNIQNIPFHLPRSKRAITERDDADEEQRDPNKPPCKISRSKELKFQQVDARLHADPARTLLEVPEAPQDCLVAIPSCLGVLSADIKKRDSAGKTPLFYAVVANRLDMTQALVKAGADVNYRDGRNRTVLHCLGEQGHIGLLSYLLAQGCDLEAQDDMRQTPLFHAVSSNHLDVVWALVEAKANLDHCDCLGQTAICKATEYQVAWPLVASGADLSVCERLNQAPVTCSIEKYLLSCAAVAQIGKKVVWTVHSGGDAHVVTLPSPSDTEDLHMLQDEFVCDHHMFQCGTEDIDDHSAAKFFEEYGISPDSHERRETIAALIDGQLGKSYAKHLSSGITLVCYHYLKLPSALDPPPRWLAGYVHFQVARPGFLKIVHLKVSRQCMRCGVGTLLLAGALQEVSFLLRGRKHSVKRQKPFELILHVVESNVAAQKLYSKLGFVEGGRDSSLSDYSNGEVTHITMARSCADLAQLSASWLRTLPGSAK